MKRRVFSLLTMWLAAFLLAAMFRYGLFEGLTLSSERHRPMFMAGDYILVNRWSYGYRLPFAPYRRYCGRMPHRGDWVAYNVPAYHDGDSPAAGVLRVGQILALPGDTVWIGACGNVSCMCDYASGCVWPFVVPASGTNACIHPWSGCMYADVINRHESDSAFFQCDTLIVNGVGALRYVFHRDYFWISSGQDDNLSDSRTFGLVPRESLMGKVEYVLYSLDSQRPWFDMLRRNRLFYPIH